MTFQIFKNRFAIIFTTLFVLVSYSEIARSHEYEVISDQEMGKILADTGMEWVKRGAGGWTSGHWVATTTGTEIGFARTAQVAPTNQDLADWNRQTDIPEATVLDNGYLMLEHYMVVKGTTDKSILETFLWFKPKAEDAVKFFESHALVS